MRLHFSKMHGLGNDFMVVDAIRQNIDPTRLDIRQLADRRFGVGFDQLLVLENSDNDAIDFRYRIFNADGSEVEQCGNGARCFARFVRDKGFSDKNPIQVETSSGIISLSITDNEQVRVDMGSPVFTASDIPFAGHLAENNMVNLDIDGTTRVAACVLSMGNPHAVIEVTQFDDQHIQHIGSHLQQDASFPQQVNVGFMRIIDPQHIELRVFERGVGETLACGTGACAAVVAGIIQGKLANKVSVTLRGGTLSIEWQGGDSHVIMQGEATWVYDGDILIEDM